MPADEVKPIVPAKPTPQKAAAANKAAAAAANDGSSGSPSGLSPGGGSEAVVKQETGGVGAAAAAGGGSSGVSGGGSSGEEFRADLGAMKRVSVSTYKGAVNVGIREFYQVRLSRSVCLPPCGLDMHHCGTVQ